ncbi:unnamed protein product [Durusdinium trenchii]|uniref:Uncharacterized protein n=1 Tax=Durusdinium trenchii TaxID=1381693 RepID=A0ABP0JY68_9DINO
MHGQGMPQDLLFRPWSRNSHSIFHTFVEEMPRVPKSLGPEKKTGVDTPVASRSDELSGDPDGFAGRLKSRLGAFIDSMERRVFVSVDSQIHTAAMASKICMAGSDLLQHDDKKATMRVDEILQSEGRSQMKGLNWQLQYQLT